MTVTWCHLPKPTSYFCTPPEPWSQSSQNVEVFTAICSFFVLWSIWGHVGGLSVAGGILCSHTPLPFPALENRITYLMLCTWLLPPCLFFPLNEERWEQRGGSPPVCGCLEPSVVTGHLRALDTEWLHNDIAPPRFRLSFKSDYQQTLKDSYRCIRKLRRKYRSFPYSWHPISLVKELTFILFFYHNL